MQQFSKAPSAPQPRKFLKQVSLLYGKQKKKKNNHFLTPHNIFQGIQKFKNFLPNFSLTFSFTTTVLDLHIHAAASDPFKNNNFNAHGKYRVKWVVGIGFQNRHLNKLWSKNNVPLHFKKRKKEKKKGNFK